MTDYFFVSSPLHFLMAANVSLGSRERRKTTVIMAKNLDAGARLRKVARQFPGIYGRLLDISELSSRRRTTVSGLRKHLAAEFARPMQARIFTGNDRRLEFQYAMHLASRAGSAIEGVYLDEGAVTYTGHKSMRRWQHRYLDPCVKKLAYGLWYKNAVTTGTSAWIQAAHVAFPEMVHPLLRGKQLVRLDPSIGTSETFKQLAMAMLDGHEDYQARLRGIKLMLSLPHEGAYLGDPACYRDLFAWLRSRFSRQQMAVKPHPRITRPDIPRQMFPGVTVLDHRAGMESLLPLLDHDCIVAGDISSTLLTTRWLRPDLAVVALLTGDRVAASTTELYQRLSISLVRPGSGDFPAPPTAKAANRPPGEATCGD